jgi:hypothetical protein
MAPGGIAEMCITAKVLQLGVPLVTAAHVVRVLVLISTASPVFEWHVPSAPGCESSKPLVHMHFSPLEGDVPKLGATSPMLEFPREVPMSRPGYALGRLAFWSRYQ